ELLRTVEADPDRDLALAVAELPQRRAAQGNADVAGHLLGTEAQRGRPVAVDADLDLGVLVADVHAYVAQLRPAGQHRNQVLGQLAQGFGGVAVEIDPDALVAAALVATTLETDVGAGGTRQVIA